VQRAQASLREYIGKITQGQEDERKRLARELHDETLQSIIALNQRVQLAKQLVGEENIQESLVEIQQMIDHTMQELRRLTRALRPLYLEDLGLVAALEMLAQETGEISGIPVRFYQRGSESRLPDQAEIAIYRIVQEALSNITRHAQAESAAISLVYQPDEVLLTITDDGRGFEVSDNLTEFSTNGHFGLLGICERAELIGAKINIQSEKGKGSQLYIQLPL
jgi:signal transduction histidine kinase